MSVWHLMKNGANPCGSLGAGFSGEAHRLPISELPEELANLGTKAGAQVFEYSNSLQEIMYSE